MGKCLLAVSREEGLMILAAPTTLLITSRKQFRRCDHLCSTVELQRELPDRPGISASNAHSMK